MRSFTFVAAALVIALLAVSVADAAVITGSKAGEAGVTVTAAMTIDFYSFTTQFNYQQHQCHRCWLFSTCCECKAQEAHFGPAGSTSADPVSGVLLFRNMPTATLSAGQSQVMSPDGSTSCNPASFSGFGTPAFPLGTVQQSFTCSVLADGSVQALNLVNPQWANEGRTAGSVVYQNGVPTFNGCSIATAQYTGAAWTETGGGNQGCGATTGALTSQGMFTASGYCCVGVTPTLVPSSGNTCFGTISY